MNVLMYPLGQEDDFPDEFCAIRQGSGEHWFYTPVGEDASWMLFRALADNAKLRELVADMWLQLLNAYDYKEVDDFADRMRELAIAATLGSCNCSDNCTNSERTETCHIDLVGYNQHEDRFQCRSCDWSMWFKRGTWPQFNYCPNCGKRVEQ